MGKGSEAGLTALLTELTQVRELRPLPARSSITVIADSNHSPGLLSEPGSGVAGRVQSSGSSRDFKFIEHFPRENPYKVRYNAGHPVQFKLQASKE